MPTEATRLLAPAEIEDVARRLVERDPSLDLPRFVPRLIATLYELEAAVRAAQADAAEARATVADTERRMEHLIVEITRRDAVIDAARRCEAEARTSLAPMGRAFISFDRGDVVISS